MNNSRWFGICIKPFCVYLAGYLQKGAEYAAAFFLHRPGDKMMLRNKNYLVEEKHTPEEWFVPPQVRKIVDKLAKDL